MKNVKKEQKEEKGDKKFVYWGALFGLTPKLLGLKCCVTLMLNTEVIGKINYLSNTNYFGHL